MTKVTVEGLKELEAVMESLGKSLSRGVMRRAATKALTPMIEDAKSRVSASTQNTGDLEASMGVSSKLSKTQAKAAKKETKSFVEMYAGAGSLQQATLLEFGTGERFTSGGKSVGTMQPEPYMRPAFDAAKGDMPQAVGRELWIDIEKTAARKARRDARKAAKEA